MNYSAVVITMTSRPLDETLDALNAVEGLEVHQIDRDTRRAVAVIEAETTGKEADVFEVVRHTEGVLDISLVNHFFEEEAEAS